jgi:hypothetical protein
MAWLEAVPKEFAEAQVWLDLLKLPCGDAWVKIKIVSFRNLGNSTKLT